jgi:hypothetical protein
MKPMPESCCYSRCGVDDHSLAQPRPTRRTADGGTENRKGDRSPLVAHVDEQAALKRILRHRKQNKGARRIAAALNRRGANPRSGKAWTPESVAAILRRLDRWEAADVSLLAA